MSQVSLSQKNWAVLMRMRIWSLFVICCAALAAATGSSESVQDLLARFSPDQSALWERASKAFDGQQYADALSTYKQLLAQLPGNAILLKFASESALSSGEDDFALTALKPLADKDPNDWQAISLLAQACAESGDVACRDTNMERMLALHRQGVAPPGLRQYLLERIEVGDKTLLILPSLEPVGYYKIYDLGRVMDWNGRIFLRMTVESGDADQAGFAKDHRKDQQPFRFDCSVS